VETVGVSPSTSVMSWRASFWQTCLEMADGLGPAGSGARVVGVVEAVLAEHPAAASASSTVAATTRVRTDGQYQGRPVIPVQDTLGGSSMATSSTCSVMGNRSKARSEPRDQPASVMARRSRANEAGSQAT
jgi:hypothetical protein